MRTKDEMAEMAGNLMMRAKTVYHLGPYHATALAPESDRSAREPRLIHYITLDWIIFGTGFDLALHANQGRNGRNDREPIDS